MVSLFLHRLCLEDSVPPTLAERYLPQYSQSASGILLLLHNTTAECYLQSKFTKLSPSCAISSIEQLRLLAGMSI